MINNDLLGKKPEGKVEITAAAGLLYEFIRFPYWTRKMRVFLFSDI
jgi:hypothetical protein